MAYVGNQNYQAYITLASQTFTTSGSTTIYSLSYSVSNANNIALYINNVPQQPSVAYTAAGNTLTLTTATSSSMYAVYLGQGIQTTNLPVGVVGISNLSASGTAGSTNFLRGDNSWNGVGINQLTATGSPSSATFLRGDNTWASSALTGNVLQVITATDSTQRSTTSTTYVTGSNTLSVSITPSSASNKILIFCSTAVQATGSGEINVTIYRNSTNLAGTGSFSYSYDTVPYASNNIGINYLDSPNTTSAITYQIYFRITSGTAQINVGNIGGVGSITCMEIKG